MKRKVIKQGNGTLTMTLPKNWTEDVGLKGNSEIEIRVEENHIVVSPAGSDMNKAIEIDVDNYERLSLAKFLIVCYEQGIDTMTLSFSKQKINSWVYGDESVTDVIHFFVNRLIGFEVLSQTRNSIKIGNLSEKHIKFQGILSRIFFLIEEYIQHATEAMENFDYSDLKNGEVRHDNITKLIALASRIVNDSKTLTKVESMNLFLILNILDKVTDFCRYVYKNTLAYNKKVSKSTLDLAKEVYKFVEMYRSFFNKYDYKAINALDRLRGAVKKSYQESVKKYPAEAAINSNFDAFVETMAGAIKPRISIELVNSNLTIEKSHL